MARPPFIADVVPETAGRIEELLAKARAEDAKVHEQAEGALPAGDADPYRAPRILDADVDEDDEPDDDVDTEA